MKKIFFVIVVYFIALQANAQQKFEGSLVYQTKLNSSNPDPKEDDFFKSRQSFQCSGNTVRYQVQGGINDSTDMLLDFEKEQYFFIDAAHKRLIHMLHAPIPKSPNAILKKLEEKQMILGTTCTKYQIIDSSKPQTNIYIWACDQLMQPMKSRKFTFQEDEHSQKGMGIMLAQMSDLAGGKLILKLIMEHPQDKSTIITELTSIVKQKPDPSIFILPKGYTQVETKIMKMNLD